MAERIPMDKLELLSPRELGNILLAEVDTFLHINKNYVKELLYAGADTTIKNYWGQTAWDLAPIIIKYLFPELNPEYQNSLISLDELVVMSPKKLGDILLDELQKGAHNIKYVRDIIAAGANVNIHDDDGVTPLAHAVYHEKNDMVELLLEAGANVNHDYVDFYGNTLLHTSASEGFIDIVGMLLAAGADKNILNNDGKTAWDVSDMHVKSNYPELNPN